MVSAWPTVLTLKMLPNSFMSTRIVDRGVVFYTCCHMDHVGHLRCDELGGHLKVVGLRDVIVHQAVDQTKLR